MHKLLQFIKYYQLPILSGLFIGTSYIPFYPWALLFAYAPLFIFWSREANIKKVFIGGWLTQFVLNSIGFYWIIFTVKEFGEMPYPLAFVVQQLFNSIAHLYFPLAGAIWFYLKRKIPSSNLNLIWLPPIFVIIEHFYPSMFQWHMGYVWFWSGLPGFHFAELMGFVGLYLLTLFFSSIIAWYFCSRKEIKNAFLAPALVVLFFVLINVGGIVIKSNLPIESSTLKVLAVQANIGNAMKVAAEKGQGANIVEEILEVYLKNTDTAIKTHGTPDIVAWPETAFQGAFLSSKSPASMSGQKLINYVKENKINLVTGTYERGPYPDFKMYNAMTIINDEGLLSDFYEKSILLAFGEYLPGSETFPILKKWLPMIADFGRGKGSNVVPWKDIKIGLQICYEGLFDYLTQMAKVNGAHIIINATNDSWYDLLFEPRQHMFMTLSRAIEFRIPLVRVTNTGITSAVTSRGDVLQWTPQNQEASALYEIPIHKTPQITMFAKILPWKLTILFTMLFVMIGGAFVFHRRN